MAPQKRPPKARAVPRKRAGSDDGFAIEQNNATGGVSFWEERLNQSVGDRDGISLVDYIHAMYAFLRQAQCRHVMMIGCGGGTLATMLRRADVAVTIADIDGRNFEIARTYFHMPDDVECHVSDGRDFLRRDRRQYDAIVIDAYVEDHLPKHFMKRTFFDLVKSRLRPRGALVLVNLMAGSLDDRSADRVAWLMRETWPRVRLLDSEGYESRNLVAVAGSVGKLKRPRLMLRPHRGGNALARELRDMDFRPLRR